MKGRLIALSLESLRNGVFGETVGGILITLEAEQSELAVTIFLLYACPNTHAMAAISLHDDGVY